MVLHAPSRGPGRRPADRRAQHGYALMIVLGVIGLTSAVVGALLSLSLTTSRVGVALENDAAVRRAVDGALEAAVAQLRARPDGGTGDHCDPAPLSAVESVPFDMGSADGADDVTVTVGCTPAPDVAVGAVEAEVPGGSVELVGAGAYRGGLAWADDCPAGTPAAGASPDCLPWKLSLGVGRFAAVGARIPALEPLLVHTGDSPLQFGGSVSVRNGAAALRNPADEAPAVLVSETYAQGAAGAFAAEAGGPCGVLDPLSPWGVGAATVVDSDGSPTCSDSAAGALRPGDADQGAPFPDPADVGSVPGCGGGPVVTFSPGSYPPDDTARVNDLLDGSCPDRTFHFPPGTYRFDADDAGAGANRNALVVDDPTAKVVFGAPRGWTSSTGADDDDFPLACDPSLPGASIALTARTAIRHEAGRVAICPASSAGGAAHPALVQTGTVPPEVEAVGVGSTGSAPWNTPANLIRRASDGAYSSDNSFNCTVTLGWCDSPKRTFTTTWRHSGNGPLRALRVSMTGGIVGDTTGGGTADDNIGNFDAGRFVEFAVRPAGASSPVCTARFRSLSELYPTTTSYDLFSEPACRSALTEEEQLDGARIDTTVWYTNSCVLGTCYRQSLDMTGVALLTNPLVGTAGSATTSGGAAAPHFADPDRVRAADGSAAEVSCTPVSSLEGLVTWEERDCGAVRTRQLTLSDLADRSGELDPTDRVSGLRVMVRYQPPAARIAGVLCRTCQQVVAAHGGSHMWNRLSGATTFTLTTPGGTCSKTFRGTIWVAARHDITYDLSDSPDCARLVDTVGELDGGSLVMAVELPCDPDSTPANCRVQPMSAVDQVTVLAAVDRGTRTHSWLTLDAAAGSSFHAAGSAVLPNTDLDLRWLGASSVEPLFSESLVLAGLGSVVRAPATDGGRVDAGTVCCSRLLVPVRLEACVDGVRWGEAVVRVGARRSDGTRPVAVMEWDLGGGSQACSTPPVAVTQSG